MIIVNLKNYSEVSGTKLESFLRRLEELDNKPVLCPQHVDLEQVSSLGYQTLAQSVSYTEDPKTTGSNTAESIARAGATGTLINHSENRVQDSSKIGSIVEKCKAQGLKTVLCFQDPDKLEKYQGYGPDYLAYEDPELISGEKSVSKARSTEIKKICGHADKPVLVGAGISDAEDVRKALELGAEGILAASAIVKSDDPAQKIRALSKPLNASEITN